MSAREVIARDVWGADVGAGTADEVVSCGVPNWQLCLSEADAILAALDAAGLVVVPKEPTRRMLNRGLEGADINWRAASEDEALSDDEVIRIYRAMLAAAKEGER